MTRLAKIGTKLSFRVSSKHPFMKFYRAKLVLSFLIAVASIVVVSCDRSTLNKLSPETLNDLIEHRGLGYPETLHVDGIELGYNELIFRGDLRADFKEDDDINCNDWSITKSDLRNILSKLKQVDGVVWGAQCYSYPCLYRGEVSNEENDYNITVDAASTVMLIDSSEVLYFIASNTLPFFMAPCDCCE